MRTRRSVREARRLRCRRIRAVLAGGLVLGIGTAVTLAAWNDSEYSAATFTAGQFGIVGATDGVAFTDHPVASPAALTFTVAPTAMAPGNTTYALFSVKTVNPSVAGTLQLTAGAPTGTGLAPFLTYGVKTVTGPTCNSTTYAAGTSVSVVADGSALTAGGATAQSLAANGAAAVNYCIAVTLPTAAPNGAQGLTMTQTWTFTGTSS